MRSYDHNYRLDGYLIWTTFKLEPKPTAVNYNPGYVLFFINEKYIKKCKWDGAKWNLSFNKQTIPIIVIMEAGGSPSHGIHSFINILSIGKSFDFFYQDSIYQTRMFKGYFLIKKAGYWKCYHPFNLKKETEIDFRREEFYDKKTYKITFNKKDTVIVKPIWYFNFVETLEGKDLFD